MASKRHSTSFVPFNLSSRESLVASLPHHGVVAEIGVEKGDFANEILIRNQPTQLHLIDCWEHQSEAIYGDDPCNVPNEAQQENYKFVLRRFAGDLRVHIYREFSVPAAARFPDEFFDWVYIDANHLQMAHDLASWWPKVTRGGWLVGHDYCVLGNFINVQPVVDSFAHERGLTVHVTQESSFPTWLLEKR